ncbi:rhomboid family intramembrane serine protease [Pontibacillus salicampi]|uniref:Rhomboid family intramembrane serine protease n=1 Tax=Pontibacillus salicampi TaxID=1449801 RepID=A0ABV6LJN9_9BACI
MYIEESYYFWRLASDIMINHEFEVLQLDENKEEIWLERRDKNTSYVVRLSHQSFDWANQIKQDQRLLEQNVNRVKKVLASRKLVIHNVYIAQYPPVDDWEEVSKTRNLNQNKNITLHTFYLDHMGRAEEMKKLYHTLSLPEPDFQQPSEMEMEQMIGYLQQSIKNNHERKRKERQEIFAFGKPILTYLLIAINLIMFTIIEWNGGSTDTYTLVEYGAKYNPAIIDGEWWRIVSSMFLHIGFLHITLNMLALYVLGSVVERMYGSIRFLPIYFIGGIVGGLASFAFTPNVAAGASGAIYGLFGALLFFGVVYRKLFFQTIGMNVIIILVLNIGFSIVMPQVDNGAHLGGLLGGFLASSMVHLPRNKAWGRQLGSLALIAVVAAGLGYYGLNHSDNHYDAAIQAQVGSGYLQNDEFDKAIDIANRALPRTEENNDLLYFVRGNGYYGQKEYEKAKADYQKAISLNANRFEAYINLSIIYRDVEQNQSEALKLAKKAQSIDPGNEKAKEIIQSLGESG